MRESSAKRNFLVIVLALALALSPVLGGCTVAQDVLDNLTQREVTSENAQERFDALSNRIFAHVVSQDTVSLNSTLAHPENFAITPSAPTLGEFTEQNITDEIDYSMQEFDELQSIDSRALSATSQIDYALLEYYLDLDREYQDLIYYMEPLRVNGGLQAAYTIMLSEFNIDDTEDIENYLGVLADTGRYLEQVEEFEREKAARKLFMSDEAAKKVIEQCDILAKDADNNAMITIFDQRLNSDEAPFVKLSKAERNALSQRNRDIVLQNAAPAFKSLSAVIAELSKDAVKPRPLADLPKGAEYYELLMRDAGFGESIATYEDELEAAISQAFKSLGTSKAEPPSYEVTDPVKALKMLAKGTPKYFPELKDVDFKIKYTTPELGEDMGVAFYLVPRIDVAATNIIYINKSKVGQSNTLDVLAHEGYPGHLYQTNYYAASNPAPIRSQMEPLGYVEGFAMYAESYAYALAGKNGSQTQIAKDALTFDYAISAYLDIQINYRGWTLEKVTEYLAQFGMMDEQVSLYSDIADSPGLYVNYGLGMVEFTNMLENYRGSDDSLATLKQFNKSVLDIGPVPLTILKEHLLN